MCEIIFSLSLNFFFLRWYLPGGGSGFFFFFIFFFFFFFLLVGFTVAYCLFSPLGGRLTSPCVFFDQFDEFPFFFSLLTPFEMLSVSQAVFPECVYW